MLLLNTELPSEPEKVTENHGVAGSIPALGTKLANGIPAAAGASSDKVGRVKLEPSIWGSIFPELVKPDDAQVRPILGFRVNRVQLVRRWWGKPSVVLRSMGPSGFIWDPGRNAAVCGFSRWRVVSRPRHSAPATGCSCGLYACHDLRQLLFPHVLANQVVLAAVAGTGIVRIHTLGWRAQYARIVALSLELPEMSIVPHVRELLGEASRREDQILRLLGYDENAIRAQMGRKVYKQLSPVIARALETKYQVPVVPLHQLEEVIADAGVFWEGIQ
ncbi:MAG TPA: hypothetical protein VFR68_15095 [Candidatus Dormibacteraeota bacterium]|nr:hypothetical protein [Candidatus Dormibacteraeota bacterium]